VSDSKSEPSWPGFEFHEQEKGEEKKRGRNYSEDWYRRRKLRGRRGGLRTTHLEGSILPSLQKGKRSNFTGMPKVLNFLRVCSSKKIKTVLPGPCNWRGGLESYSVPPKNRSSRSNHLSMDGLDSSGTTELAG